MNSVLNNPPYLIIQLLFFYIDIYQYFKYFIIILLFFLALFLYVFLPRTFAIDI